MTDRAYGRISLDTLASGSIEKQKERLLRFAGDDVEWYEDRSVSGSKVPFPERPSGARLLADLRGGDRLLVTKIDRAARNVRDLLTLVETVESLEASVVFVDQNIDTAGPMGRFLLTLLAAIAELEAGIIAERRRESLEAFKASGRHAVGKAPFGFKSVDRPDGRGLVIVPEWEIADGFDASPAEMVRRAVERVMAGESQEVVRTSLNQAASVTAVARYEEAATRAESSGGKPPAPLFSEMSKTGIHNLLHNPRLAGMTPDGDGVVMIEGIPRVDQAAALLTMAEWRALQDFLNGKPEKKWSRREGYGAALKCGVCRERMYVNVAKKASLATGKTHDTYTCRRVKHAKGESAPSVMVHKADAYLEERFLELFGERRAVVASWSDSSSARLEAVSIARVRLDAVRQAQDAAVTEEEEEAADAAYREARKALKAAEAMPDERAFAVEETGKTVMEVWEAADVAERTRLLSRSGDWILHRGRAPIDERITLEGADLLHELLTHRVGSDSDVHVDANSYLL